MEQKNWLSTEEAAEKLGCTVAYARELCNRSKYDEGIKLKAEKIGKEWKINPQSINEMLGIRTDKQSLERELYIKELESKIREYEVKLNAMQSLFKSASGVLNV